MKSYQIVDKKTGITEYIVKYNDEDKEVYELLYSHNGLWSDGTAGTLALTMIDNGNFVSFKPPMKKAVDYGDLERYRVLLSFQERIKTSLKNEYTIIEEKLIAEI